MYEDTQSILKKYFYNKSLVLADPPFFGQRPHFYMFLDPSLTKETEGLLAFLYFHKEFLALSQNIVFYV